MLRELGRDLRDIALILTRAATDTGTRIGLDEVITTFGYDRLDKTTAGLSATPEPPAEPVPDWLVKRLTQQVGLTPDAVARMNLQEAVDAWTDWTSHPRPTPLRRQ